MRWSLGAGLLTLSLAGCAHHAAEPQPASVLPRVDHILLEVRDLDRSLAFYRDQLGLRVKERSSDFVMLDSGNVGIYLWSKHWEWSTPPLAGPRPPSGMYPHLAVADAKALMARLRADGYTIVANAEDYSYGTEGFVADPDGFVWAIISAPR